MSCEAVRAALIDGTSLDPLTPHLTTCPACATLAAGRPSALAVHPPHPDPARLGQVLRRRRAVRIATVSLALAALGLAWIRVGPPPGPPASPVAVGAPSVAEGPEAAATDTGDVLAHPERLAVLDLGSPLADDPVDLDPLADFDDPTDLLTTALLGNGNL